MKQEPKMINYYNQMLMKGCLHGLSVTADNKLCINKKADNSDCCAYFTRVFDTEDIDMTFHRLVMDIEAFNVKVELIVTATNESDVFVDDVSVNLFQYIADKSIAPEKKAELLKGLGGVRFINETDVLLHDITGRYLYIAIIIHQMEDSKACLSGFRVELPKYSFVEYFPEIFQSDDGFFERYVGIFQSMFLDLEKKVDLIPQLLDFESTELKNVKTLASWVGLEDLGGVFSDSQLKAMMKNLELFQGGKGTKNALSQVVLLATGIKPKILEHFEWDEKVAKNPERESLYKSLYGSDSNCFTVILDTTQKELAIKPKALKQLILSYSPMGSEVQLILLKPNSHLDSHCYLGVNSRLSALSIASSDGFILGEYVMIGENRKSENGEAYENDIEQ